MSWLSDIIKKISFRMKYADMLSGYTPIFSQFGSDIYKSDVVQQAIDCIVKEIKKLNPQHVRSDGADVVPINSSIQRCLKQPNQFMTTSEFLEKITWQLYFNYNAFIIPTYYLNEKNQKVYTGVYPVAPTQVDFLQDEATGRLFIKFRFANNYETTLPYSEVIHWRLKYSVNEFMGGNELGQPDFSALIETLQLNQDMLKGVSGAIKSSFTINGIVKFKSMLDNGKTEKAMKELEEKIKNSENGFMPLDISSEFIPLKKEVKLVDADTLKFIDEKILRFFGVPLPILTGDYTKQQYEAFYQKTLEPLIISLTQAFTRTLFTANERSFGNEIRFYPKDLIFMSVDQTLEMVRLLGDSGSIYENEKRTAFGLRPLPELEGVRMQSLNYVNVNIADKYQLGGDPDEHSEGDN